jgi:hypothetical protein
MSQRRLSEVLETAQFEALLAAAPSRADRVRLRAVAQPGAGAFLCALPGPGTSFSGAEFLVAVRLRLGLPLFAADDMCRFCGAPLDAGGYHALTCRRGGFITRRHSAFRDAVFELAARGALAPRKEVGGIFRDGRGGERPADVLVPGCPTLVIDVAVTHPGQPAYAADASESGLAAAERYAADVKGARFAAAVVDTAVWGSVRFVPAVAEVFGGLCAAGRDLLRYLSRALAARTGEHPAVAAQYAAQRISVALQRGNARAILARRPVLACAADVARVAWGPANSPAAPPCTTPAAAGAEVPAPDVASALPAPRRLLVDTPPPFPLLNFSPSVPPSHRSVLSSLSPRLL